MAADATATKGGNLPEGSYMWQIAEGVELFVREWKPAAEVRVVAHVTLVHGLGEHVGRYDAMCRKLTAQGIQVGAFDQRGFGRSSGSRGDGDVTEVTMGDILAVMNKTAPEGVPRFLFGHSMGGLNGTVFAATRAAEAHLVGAVISSPLYRTTFEPPKIKVAVGRLLAKIEYINRITIASELNEEGISRDPEVVRDYMADPLVHSYVSLRTANSFFTYAEMVIESLHQNVTIPVLVVHGNKDMLTSYKATEEVFAKFPSKDKTLKIYEGCYHELHMEPEKDEIIQSYVDWILAHANPSKL